MSDLHEIYEAAKESGRLEPKLPAPRGLKALLLRFYLWLCRLHDRRDAWIRRGLKIKPADWARDATEARTLWFEACWLRRRLRSFPTGRYVWGTPADVEMMRRLVLDIRQEKTKCDTRP
jgi:hypothetical protein